MSLGTDPSEQMPAGACGASLGLAIDQDFLVQLLNGLPRPVFVKDEQHRLVLVNDAYCAHVGRSAEWLVGKTTFAIYTEAQAQAQWDEDVAVFEFGKPTDREEAVTGRDGRTRHQLIRKNRFTTAEGRRFLVGVIVDVTGLKQAEVALAVAQERIEHLLASSPAVIYSLAATGDHAPTFVGENVRELFGFAREEYLGSPDLRRSRIHPDDLDRIERGFERLFDEGRLSTEYRFRRKDGSYCWVNDEQQLIRDEHGEPIEVVGSWIDVTERKKAELELKQYREHLEHLVGKRTRKIEHQAEELEKALEKEKHLTALQREFVAMVSHEFRTPLAIIDGAAQRLLRRLDRFDPAEVEQRVERIRSAIMRMTELIEGVLSLSRLEAGVIEFYPEPCPLAELVQDVCRRQQDITPDHSIEVDVEDLPLEILADPTLLNQVFSNLLSNAVKYAPTSPKIEVRGWSEGDRACVSVRDEGLGIPAEEVPRLFEKYFRAKTSAGISGTGIGLYLIKQLVEMHAGQIEVESELGQGSTFVVRLPKAA